MKQVSRIPEEVAVILQTLSGKPIPIQLLTERSELEYQIQKTISKYLDNPSHFVGSLEEIKVSGERALTQWDEGETLFALDAFGDLIVAPVDSLPTEVREEIR